MIGYRLPHPCLFLNNLVLVGCLTLFFPVWHGVHADRGAVRGQYDEPARRAVYGGGSWGGSAGGLGKRADVSDAHHEGARLLSVLVSRAGLWAGRCRGSSAGQVSFFLRWTKDVFECPRGVLFKRAGGSYTKTSAVIYMQHILTARVFVPSVVAAPFSFLPQWCREETHDSTSQYVKISNIDSFIFFVCFRFFAADGDL